MNDKIQKLKEYAAARPCGTRAKYVSGCRCMVCRAANSRYQTEREERKKSGGDNPLVDASAAREHMKKLSKLGIGYKTVADYSGVGKSTVFQVMTGEKTKLRKRNSDAILAVDRGCFNGGTLVPAGETWKRIRWMRSEGFTDREIAKRLGIRCGHLQISVKKITGRTAARVERLYRLVREGE